MSCEGGYQVIFHGWQSNPVSIVICRCQGVMTFDANVIRKIYFYCMGISVLLVCMSIYVLHVCLGPEEARRGHQILWH